MLALSDLDPEMALVPLTLVESRVFFILVTHKELFDVPL